MSEDKYSKIFGDYIKAGEKVPFSKLAREFKVSKQAIQSAWTRFNAKANLETLDPPVINENIKKLREENTEERELIEKKALQEIKEFFNIYDNFKIEYKKIISENKEKLGNEMENLQHEFIFKSKMFIKLLEMMSELTR